MAAFPPPPSAFPLPRIAIIGGGITGLAAAYRLEQLCPQVEIELFEASGRLGGVIQTVERDGFLIEQAADNFLVKPAAALELCREIGIAGELLTTDETRRRAFVVRGGRLVPVPTGFYLMSPRQFWPLMTSPALSPLGKLRLMLEPFIPPTARSFDPNSLLLAPPDESIADFTRRRLGREVLEQLVQPLVAGIYTADPEQLSMAATMPQFVNYEREYGSLLRATLFSRAGTGRLSDQSGEVQSSTDAASGARYGLFVAPKQGMTSFIEILASKLGRTAIQLNSPVTSITKSGDAFQFASNSKSYNALILALPASQAARLLRPIDAPLATELSAIPYAGCAVASCAFARKQIGHALDGFGFVVPQREGRRIIAGSFASLKFPGRAPEDHVIIRAFLGGALQPQMLQFDDDTLLNVAAEELASLLRITGKPVMTNLARWPASMPQYHVGHLSRVAHIERLAARNRGLALAGNAYRGVGIPQCVASATSAAERIAQTINTP